MIHRQVLLHLSRRMTSDLWWVDVDPCGPRYYILQLYV